MTGFSWNKRREQAASFVAEDRLSDEKIAAQLGISRKTLAEWKRVPEFSSRVADLVAAFRDAIEARGIADKQNRVNAQDDRWKRMRQVIEERAAETAMSDIPGGKTGLLVRSFKLLGRGEDAQLVEEFAVDTGLLKSLLEHEKQAAIELKQWTEQKELSTKDGEPLKFTIVLDRRDDSGE